MRRWAGGRQRPGSGYYESRHQGVVTTSLVTGDGRGKWIKPMIFLDAFGGIWVSWFLKVILVLVLV